MAYFKQPYFLNKNWIFICDSYKQLSHTANQTKKTAGTCRYMQAHTVRPLSA